jgi:hypothetical protein
MKLFDVKDKIEKSNAKIAAAGLGGYVSDQSRTRLGALTNHQETIYNAVLKVAAGSPAAELEIKVHTSGRKGPRSAKKLAKFLGLGDLGSTQYLTVVELFDKEAIDAAKKGGTIPVPLAVGVSRCHRKDLEAGRARVDYGINRALGRAIEALKTVPRPAAPRFFNKNQQMRLDQVGKLALRCAGCVVGGMFEVVSQK